MANSQGKSRVSKLVPMPVPISTNRTGELAELIELWHGMDEPARRDLLEMLLEILSIVCSKDFGLGGGLLDSV
jgi:hypothetical protein